MRYARKSLQVGHADVCLLNRGRCLTCDGVGVKRYAPAKSTMVANGSDCRFFSLGS